jgi:hypothetical protein
LKSRSHGANGSTIVVAIASSIGCCVETSQPKPHGHW